MSTLLENESFIYLSNDILRLPIPIRYIFCLVVRFFRILNSFIGKSISRVRSKEGCILHGLHCPSVYGVHDCSRCCLQVAASEALYPLSEI